MTDRFPRAEPQSLPGEAMAVIRWPITVSDGGVHFPGTPDAQVGVILLADPVWPRAVLQVWSRAKPLSKNQASALAEECLRLCQGPLAWSEDLAAFVLQESRVIEAEEFWLGVQESTRGLRGRLREGEETWAWDLASGRCLPVGELKVRGDVYADVLANPADVTLSTRFIGFEMPYGPDPRSNLQELHETLEWVGRHGFGLIDLTVMPDHAQVEFECTVEGWFDAYSDRLGETDLINGLASHFFDIFQALTREQAETVRRRLGALYREYLAREEWRSRSSTQRP